MQKFVWSEDKFVNKSGPSIRKNAEIIFEYFIEQLRKKPNQQSIKFIDKNLFALSELLCTAELKIPFELFCKLLFQMFKEGKFLISDFEDYYYQSQPLSQNLVKHNLKVFFRTDVLIDQELEGIVSFHILGKKFTYKNFNEVRSDLDEADKEEINKIFKTFKDSGIDFESDRVPINFFTTTIETKNYYEGLEEIQSIFDTLRGIPAFLETKINVDFHISESNPSDVITNLIPESRWIMTKVEGLPIQILRRYISKSQKNKPNTITRNKFEQITNYCNLLKTMPKNNSTRSLIADCFRLYSQALDTANSHECFINLWQIAEAITRGVEHNGETRFISHRLIWHCQRLDLIGSGFSQILKKFEEKRNNYVHHGTSIDILPDDINIMKNICDVAFKWLIGVQESLQTKESLEQFYLLRDHSDSSIKAIKDSLDYLNR